jgi:ActR/RegA family two-component response regulator
MSRGTILVVDDNELIDEIKRVHPAAVVIVLTAERSPETRTEAVRRGAFDYLTKPADIDDVIAALIGAEQQ